MNSGKHKPRIAGKKPSHRKAILRSLLLEMIRAERIQTTQRKAKLVKQQFDRLVTEAKKDTEASKRNVASTLRNELAETKLYGKLLPRLADRNSGYLQSARTLPRKGDNAPQIILMVHGTELRETRSRLAKVLQRQDTAKQQKADSGVAGRIRKAVTGGNAAKGGGKHESKKDIRRVST